MYSSLPAGRAYYYEITNISERLMYWIPFKELKKLVEHEKVNKKILTDYPGGLDIEVSKDSFEEFNKKYKLKFSIAPKYIWQAFEKEVYKKDKKIHTPKIGYVDGKALEDIAMKEKNAEILTQAIKFAKKELKTSKAITDSTEKILLPANIDLNFGSKKSVTARQIKRLPDTHRKSRVYSYPSSSKIKVFDRELSSSSVQNLFNVKMTKGDRPFEVFSKLHKKQTR